MVTTIFRTSIFPCLFNPCPSKMVGPGPTLGGNGIVHSRFVSSH